MTTEETINALKQKVKEQEETIKGLLEIIDKLNQTISELTEKLEKNSRNSSKPPPVTGLPNPPPKACGNRQAKRPEARKGIPALTSPR